MYWRMQLHPAEPGEAVGNTVDSLVAGYIGLDFASDVGDLGKTTQQALPENQRDYWAFAHEMAVNDRVLIIAHYFPFALVRIAGPYNYIRMITPELGVWFRHFRHVDQVWYFGDFVTNARSWQKLTMTDTISPLRDRATMSYQLIERWLQARGGAAQTELSSSTQHLDGDPAALDVNAPGYGGWHGFASVQGQPPSRRADDRLKGSRRTSRLKSGSSQ